MRKVESLCASFIAPQIFFNLLLVILLAIAIFPMGDQDHAEGFVTLQEHNRLKEEMKSLKSQMNMLLKQLPTSSKAAKSNASAVDTKGVIEKDQVKQEPSESAHLRKMQLQSAPDKNQNRKSPDSSMQLTDGDRKKRL